MNGVMWCAVAGLLGAACWTDFRRLRIPNRLTVSFAVAGLLYQLVMFGHQGLESALLGAIAGGIPLLLLFVLRGMGGGDVKWFGAFGTWAGAALTLQLMVFSILYAGVIALLILFLRIPRVATFAKRFRWHWIDHPNLAGKGARFPFMAAVAPGFITLCYTCLS